MNKNTVWAILLIGAILVGFSLYNSSVAKKTAKRTIRQGFHCP